MLRARLSLIPVVLVVTGIATPQFPAASPDAYFSKTAVWIHFARWLVL